jgi:hypothetical protein
MDNLEQTITTLLERKDAVLEGSAQWRMIMRQLRGLSRTREEAGPIIEEYDAVAWCEMRHHL